MSTDPATHTHTDSHSTHTRLVKKRGLTVKGCANGRTSLTGCTSGLTSFNECTSGQSTYEHMYPYPNPIVMFLISSGHGVNCMWKFIFFRTCKFIRISFFSYSYFGKFIFLLKTVICLTHERDNDS